MVTVDLHQDLLEVRLTFDAADRAVGQSRPLLEVVVPGEVEQRLILGVGAAGVKLLKALAEVVEEPGVGATVAERVESFAVPLEQPLCVS